MTFDRRAFLRSSSLAAIAAIFAPNWTFAAVPGRRVPTSTRSVPLGTADLSVLQWISSYSSQVRLVGGGVVSRLHGGNAPLHILVEVANMDALQAALAGVIPFTGIQARGNTLLFSSEGVSFTVENLPSDSFAKQVAQLSAAKKVAFAHEALSYDPATQRLTDPLKAASSATLKLVYAGSGLAAAFHTLLRGYVEADELDFTLSPSFKQLKRRVLSVRGQRVGLARPVVAALVEQLTELSDALSAEQIESLLRSPLISTAISRILGVSVDEVIAQFRILQGELNGEGGDAVAWLASLLSHQLADSTLPDWLGGLDPVRAYRARAALSDARQLAARSTF